MIELYAFATPNSLKPVIALEELELDYVLHPVNVRLGEQSTPAFTALNPNAKVPVLVDTDAALTLTESAAILVHLAEQHDRLLPRAGEARARVFEQLFFHASAVSPAFGQAGYFTRLTPEPQPVAQARFNAEANRVLDRLEAILAVRPFVAGDDYTIADIAQFGWLWRRAFAGVTLDDRPSLDRWYAAVADRPAVQRAIARVEALVPQS